MDKEFFSHTGSFTAVLGCLSIGLSTACGQEPRSAPAFDGDILKALPTNGWITNGGNIYNQR